MLNNSTLESLRLEQNPDSQSLVREDLDPLSIGRQKSQPSSDTWLVLNNTVFVIRPISEKHKKLAESIFDTIF